MKRHSFAVWFVETCLVISAELDWFICAFYSMLPWKTLCSWSSCFTIIRDIETVISHNVNKLWICCITWSSDDVCVCICVCVCPIRRWLTLCLWGRPCCCLRWERGWSSSTHCCLRALTDGRVSPKDRYPLPPNTHIHTYSCPTAFRNVAVKSTVFSFFGLFTCNNEPLINRTQCQLMQDGEQFSLSVVSHFRMWFCDNRWRQTLRTEPLI